MEDVFAIFVFTVVLIFAVFYVFDMIGTNPRDRQ